jgi:uncharacterized membrane protein HdeD (DUF308 family)
MSDETLSSGDMAEVAASMPWWLILVWGILAVLLGILLVINPVATEVTLVLFMGAYWFIGGLFTLASLVWDRSNLGWKIFMGVISILGGIVIMSYPVFSSVLVIGMLVFLIGFWAIIIGGTKLYDAYRTKDGGTGVLGILSILLGFILLIYPFAAAYSLSLVAGFFALIGGISSIAFSFQLKKTQETAA